MSSIAFIAARGPPYYRPLSNVSVQTGPGCCGESPAYDSYEWLLPSWHRPVSTNSVTSKSIIFGWGMGFFLFVWLINSFNHKKSETT